MLHFGVSMFSSFNTFFMYIAYLINMLLVKSPKFSQHSLSVLHSEKMQYGILNFLGFFVRLDYCQAQPQLILNSNKG